MDNLLAMIHGVSVDEKLLLASLGKIGSKGRVSYGLNSDVESITFSTTIGNHNKRWLFRINMKTESISFSGGVTSTFFGHNVWVGSNEGNQLKHIITIVANKLSQIEGITLPKSLKRNQYDSVEIKRVEVTRHHLLPEHITTNEAINRFDNLFKVLYPSRRDRDGDTLDSPGTVSIGKNKSTKVCRIYDPSFKFKKRPPSISEKSWGKLEENCKNHLRVELIMSAREIKQNNLQTIESWGDKNKIGAYIEKKYKHYGLTFAANTNLENFRPKDVRSSNPTFVEYARYWITGGLRGKEPNKRHGSYNRYRVYMADRGFNINVPFKYHKLIAHGLEKILSPEHCEIIPGVLRRNKELFGMWWRL